MAQSLKDDRIAEMTVRVLQAMNYTGYGSVEFKWDPRDALFKVIEVSARTWFPHGISSACGLNIEYAAYCDQAGLQKATGNGFRNAVKWIHEERDLKSALAYFKSRELTLPQWLSSIRGIRTYAIFARDDPAPFLSMCAKWFTVPIRRVARWVGRAWTGGVKSPT